MRKYFYLVYFYSRNRKISYTSQSYIECHIKCETCKGASDYCSKCQGDHRGFEPHCSCLSGYYEGGEKDCTSNIVELDNMLEKIWVILQAAEFKLN